MMDVDELTSILRVAHTWNFTAVRDWTFGELEKRSMDPISRIKLYTDFDVQRTDLQSAIVALVQRPDPLSLDEGQEIGLDMSMLVVRARELARPTRVTTEEFEIEDLVRTIFSSLRYEQGTSRTSLFQSLR
jgi:hypothetical protein